MRFVSWNVNGLRACLTKGFMESFREVDADIFCVQETKMQPGQAILELPGYKQYWNSAEKKGYSGTAVFSRVEPLSVSYGLGIEEHDHEGRVITLELEDYYLVTVYTPNSQKELARLSYRMEWEVAFRQFLQELDKKKPVIVCGDLNVAHTEIDLKNPKTNHKSAGFTDQEREKFTALLSTGFTDTMRAQNPDTPGIYTWWAQISKTSKINNSGWRIDYYLVSDRIADKVTETAVIDTGLRQDHAPISLKMAF